MKGEKRPWVQEEEDCQQNGQILLSPVLIPFILKSGVRSVKVEKDPDGDSGVVHPMFVPLCPDLVFLVCLPVLLGKRNPPEKRSDTSCAKMKTMTEPGLMKS